MIQLKKHESEHITDILNSVYNPIFTLNYS